MRTLKTLPLTVIVLMAALTAQPALASDFTWDGEIDQYWDATDGNTTNWSPDGMANPVPDADDNVFFNGAAPYTTVELHGSHRVLSANFDGNTDYTLTEALSGDRLRLVTGDITTYGTATHEIAAKIVLEDDGDWAINTPSWSAAPSAVRSV